MVDVQNTDWKKFYTSFEGRVNRKKYWMNFALPVVLVFIFVPAIIAAIFGVKVASVVYGFLSVLVIWPKLALAAKRLHDRELSGWWQVAPFMTMVLAGIGAAIFKPLAVVFIIAAVGLGVWLAAQIGFLKGTDGPNRFGPDPLQDIPSLDNNDMGDGAQTIKIEPVGAGE